MYLNQYAAAGPLQCASSVNDTLAHLDVGELSVQSSKLELAFSVRL